MPPATTSSSTALRRSPRTITGGAANAPRISFMSDITTRYVMMVTLIYALYAG